MNARDLVSEARGVAPESYLALLRELAGAVRRSEKGVLREGSLVTVERGGEAIFVGDIHGDLDTLEWVLNDSGFFEGDSTIIFLGDYVDRGLEDVEVFYVVGKLKLLFPGRVVLLRGNHEGVPELTPYPHDLPIHLTEKYGPRGRDVYREMLRVFQSLPLVAIAAGRYLLLHGGPPTRLEALDDLKHVDGEAFEEILWSDPTEAPGTHPSPRGAGVLFGPDVTKRALRATGTKVLVRGHTPCNEGACPSQGGLTLTLFTRLGPPYFNEAAAYVKVDLDEDPGDAYSLGRRARLLRATPPQL